MNKILSASMPAKVSNAQMLQIVVGKVNVCLTLVSMLVAKPEASAMESNVFLTPVQESPAKMVNSVVEVNVFHHVPKSAVLSSPDAWMVSA